MGRLLLAKKKTSMHLVVWVLSWLMCVVRATSNQTMAKTASEKLVWFGSYGLMPTVPMMTDVCIRYNDSLSFKFNSTKKMLDIYPNTISCQLINIILKMLKNLL